LDATSAAAATFLLDERMFRRVAFIATRPFGLWTMSPDTLHNNQTSLCCPAFKHMTLSACMADTRTLSRAFLVVRDSETKRETFAAGTSKPTSSFLSKRTSKKINSGV
jgi:hypothetical protein